MQYQAIVTVSISDDATRCGPDCHFLRLTMHHGPLCGLFGQDDGNEIPTALGVSPTNPAPFRCRECIEATGHCRPS